MKNDFCFCNVSFGQRYVQSQSRLRESILKIYPEADLFFWTEEMPPNARTHQESCYGFKPHAIEHARKHGFKKVIWLDTCAILLNPVEPLFELIEESGFYTIQDDNILSRYSGISFKKEFSIKPEWHLIGGSFYIFDFTKPTAVSIFEKWKLMEEQNYYGNVQNINIGNDGVENCGHRMDETVLAYVMYNAGVRPFTHEEGRYNFDANSVVIKKHFLKEGEKWYEQKWDENWHH